jgi:hypothetical protein
MAEKSEPKPEAKPEKKAALAQAGASGDPVVHQAIAELETAKTNDNEKAIEAAKAKLADLGYE